MTTNIFDAAYSLAENVLDKSDEANAQLDADIESLADSITELVMAFMHERGYEITD